MNRKDKNETHDNALEMFLLNLVDTAEEKLLIELLLKIEEEDELIKNLILENS